jgi:hypothetical protein
VLARAWAGPSSHSLPAASSTRLRSSRSSALVKVQAIHDHIQIRSGLAVKKKKGQRPAPGHGGRLPSGERSPAPVAAPARLPGAPARLHLGRPIWPRAARSPNCCTARSPSPGGFRSLDPRPCLRSSAVPPLLSVFQFCVAEDRESSWN